MQTKHLFAIATLTMALTNIAFGQWHPEIDKDTHEVGHQGKRRRGAIGEGASDVNAITKERTETVNNNESRSRKPNGRRKPQNLLPYLEQSNLKAQRRAKQFGAGNQVEAKTTANANQ